MDLFLMGPEGQILAVGPQMPPPPCLTTSERDKQDLIPSTMRQTHSRVSLQTVLSKSYLQQLLCLRLLFSCRSASSVVTPTSPQRPPSFQAMPTSNPHLHQTPPPSSSRRHPPPLRPNAPTPWSISAGGSPSAGNAAQSRSTPLTAWRRSPPRFSPGR